MKYITIEFPLWPYAPIGNLLPEDFVNDLQLQADCNGESATVTFNGNVPSRTVALALCRDENGTCISEQDVSC